MLCKLWHGQHCENLVNERLESYFKVASCLHLHVACHWVCQCCCRILAICWQIIFMDWPSIKVPNKICPVSGMLNIHNYLYPFSCKSLLVFSPHAIRLTCFFCFRSWLLQYTLTMLIVQDGLVTSSYQRWNFWFVKMDTNFCSKVVTLLLVWHATVWFIYGCTVQVFSFQSFFSVPNEGSDLWKNSICRVLTMKLCFGNQRQKNRVLGR